VSHVDTDDSHVRVYLQPSDRLDADLMAELFGVTADDGTIRFCSLVMFEVNGTLY